MAPTRRPAITVVAADGTEVGTVGDYFGRPVTVGELPPALPRAVMAIEDRRFYDHFGVDIFGLARAVVVNLKAGDVVQGGSTISQQAAKNLFLTHERTFKRKIQELMLALWLEQKFSKDQILALYLNRAYFGAGAYGVDAAAHKFFNRPATKVNVYQAALLAGLLKAPSRYNPIANPDLAEARTREVLSSMVDAGFLSADNAAAVWQDRGRAIAVRRVAPSARYFIDWVVGQLPGFVSDRDRDVIVRTTLDPRLQRLAEEQVSAALTSPAARKADASQAALVAMAPNGAVRALVGGRDYGSSSFNRATQAYRQPGSAFKPLVYAAGLEAGLTPDMVMEDRPLQLAGWSPKNFDNRYRGEVSLRTALALSINTVAVQVAQYAGVGRVVDVARRMGITADIDPNASIALGTSEVSPLELTGAYAAIANGGIGVWPYGIEEVRDTAGNVLYTRSGSGPGRVLSSTASSELTDMMVSVVEWGTGKGASYGAPIAGKTGTSQDYRDAWFLGFSADLVTGVWMGNDDDRSMDKVTGGSLPAKLWRAFMAGAGGSNSERPLPSLVRQQPAPSEDGQREAAKDRGVGGDEDIFDRLWRVFGG
jgi:penicillin-binding protein, 1A family